MPNEIRPGATRTYSPPARPRLRLARAPHKSLHKLLLASLWLTIPTALAFSNVPHSAGITKSSQSQADLLVAGKAVSGSLARGESASFRIELRTGEFTMLNIVQEGVELLVTVLAPDSKVVTETPGTYGVREARSVCILAEVDGAYEVRLKATRDMAEPGRFTISGDSPRSPTDKDKNQITAQRAFSDGAKLLAASDDASKQQGIARYREAVRLWHDSSDLDAEAKAIYSLADAVAGLSGKDAQNEAVNLLDRLVELSERTASRRCA